MLVQSTEDILGCSKLKEPLLPAPFVFCCLCLGVHLTCMWLKQSPSKKHLVTASKKREAKGQLCELSPNMQRELLKGETELGAHQCFQGQACCATETVSASRSDVDADYHCKLAGQCPCPSVPLSHADRPLHLPSPPWIPPASSVFLSFYAARAGQQQYCRKDGEGCLMWPFPVAGTSFSLPLTRMWSGTAYFAILEATMVLSSSLIWSTWGVFSFSTMKAKAPGKQISRSYKPHTRYCLKRPRMLIWTPKKVSNHSYAQSKDWKENHWSFLQKQVRLQPSNDGLAFSWHQGLISVTMTSQHKLLKCYWDQKLANVNQLFAFCSKDISKHNPIKGFYTIYMNTMYGNGVMSGHCFSHTFSFDLMWIPNHSCLRDFRVISLHKKSSKNIQIRTASSLTDFVQQLVIYCSPHDRSCWKLKRKARCQLSTAGSAGAHAHGHVSGSSSVLALLLYTKISTPTSTAKPTAHQVEFATAGNPLSLSLCMTVVPNGDWPLPNHKQNQSWSAQCYRELWPAEGKVKLPTSQSTLDLCL